MTTPRTRNSKPKSANYGTTSSQTTSPRYSTRCAPRNGSGTTGGRIFRLTSRPDQPPNTHRIRAGKGDLASRQDHDRNLLKQTHNPSGCLTSTVENRELHDTRRSSADSGGSRYDYPH